MSRSILHYLSFSSNIFEYQTYGVVSRGKCLSKWLAHQILMFLVLFIIRYSFSFNGIALMRQDHEAGQYIIRQFNEQISQPFLATFRFKIYCRYR